MIKRRSLLDQHHLAEREQKSLTLLELIRQKGPLTRTDLSQSSGFNIVTISNYLKAFIDQGLVVERGFDVSTGGRKPVLVELNAKAGFVIGIDLGPMDYPRIVMTGLITDLKGRILHRSVKPRPSLSMDQTLEQAGAFFKRFDANYTERLHDGELEALAFLTVSKEECVIVSGDSIVYRTVGRLNMADRGVSLEQILKDIGLQKSLDWCFTENFRKTYTDKGQQDFIHGFKAS